MNRRKLLLSPTAAATPTDPLDTLADALTEYEIARDLADQKHPDNETARLIAVHKFAAVKVALAALNRKEAQ